MTDELRQEISLVVALYSEVFQYMNSVAYDTLSFERQSAYISDVYGPVGELHVLALESRVFPYGRLIQGVGHENTEMLQAVLAEAIQEKRLLLDERYRVFAAQSEQLPTSSQ